MMTRGTPISGKLWGTCQHHQCITQQLGSRYSIDKDSLREVGPFPPKVLRLETSKRTRSCRRWWLMSAAKGEEQ